MWTVPSSLLPRNLLRAMSTDVWTILRSLLPTTELWSMLPAKSMRSKSKKNITAKFSKANFDILQRCKSRELRSSVLMTHCDCVRKNGLQYDCPRRGCGGRPCCITKPYPLCCPSSYSWRYANVTFGKPTTISQPKPECKPVVKNCNPCVVDPCDECCWSNTHPLCQIELNKRKIVSAKKFISCLIFQFWAS